MIPNLIIGDLMIVWPEEQGKQQKQMHLDLMVDDLPSAVEKATRLGAVKTAKQYDMV